MKEGVWNIADMMVIWRNWSTQRKLIPVSLYETQLVFYWLGIRYGPVLCEPGSSWHSPALCSHSHKMDISRLNIQYKKFTLTRC